MKNKVVVIGNCQANTLSRFMRVLLPDSYIRLFTHTDATDDKTRRDKEAALSESRLIFSHPLHADEFGAFSFKALSRQENAFFFPPFSFTGFHPDCVYIGTSKSSPVGDYSSSIIVYSFLHGLSVDETAQMFNETVYRKLGFLDIWDISRDILVQNFSKFGIDIEDEFAAWTKQGLFMHTINHPYAFVYEDVAYKLLSKAGVTGLRPNATKFVSDHGADDIVWPVYPEIGHRLGIEGELMFKVSDRYAPAERRPCVIDLHEFIHGSFERYKTFPRETLTCRGTVKSHSESMEIMGDIISDLRRNGSRSPSARKANAVTHPYKQLPDHQFWRKAVALVPGDELDPVVTSALKIGPDEKVATAGSCFAQHIASRLSKRGFAYFVAETAPDGLSNEDAKARNYGVFSARYGNIYTTRQLLQLFDRAMGTFEPDDSVWPHPVSGFVDPFRPQIEPEGLPTEQHVIDARAEHFEAVRRIFKETDVFVFTLGLTEGWRAKKDGAVFPLAPGVAGGSFDSDRYEFINLTAKEISDDLIAFIGKLRGNNPSCRVLLTVSPVPLVATFEPRHVLVSTIYSKSALRVAAETVCNSVDNVFYFPSYEIITGHYNKGVYFEEDMRSVTSSGVDHVMRLFFKHLTVAAPDAQAAETKRAAGSPYALAKESFADRMSKLDEVVCDEEAIDR